MQIFLSYSSEHRETAEPIALALRTRGHDVFFDRDDLPPGQSYDDQIEAAIKRSDVFIFLVSPESVSPGRFTLTELKCAQRKWRSPGGHVLPVMIVRTEMQAIPAYLKAVTILEPQGNCAAEVGSAVDGMSRKTVRWPLMVAGAAAVAVLAALAGGGWYVWTGSPKPAVELVATNLGRATRGFFGEPDRFQINFKVTNKGTLAAEVSAFRVVTEPPDTLVEIPDEGEDVMGDVSMTLTSAADAAGGNTGWITWISVALKAGAPVPQRWQLCANVEGRSQCTPARDWKPQGNFSPPEAFDLEDGLSEKVVKVAYGRSGLIVVSRSPNRVYRLSSEGKILKQQDLAGEPTALSTGPLGLFVGTRGPDQIVQLDPSSLSTVAKTEVRFPSDLVGSLSEPLSTTPVSLAQDREHVWALTRGGASSTGLLYADAALKSLHVPKYFGDVAFDIRDMHLVSAADGVWGAQTDTTPASLQLFGPETHVAFDGHNNEAASCATDIAVHRSGQLLVPSCDGKLQLVDTDGAKLKVVSESKEIRQNRAGTGLGTTTRLVPLSDTVMVATNVTVDPGGRASRALYLYRVIISGAPWEIFKLDGAHIVDMAASETVTVLVLENEAGKRETITIKNDNP
jgi:hypothetical protein